jgi:hypothetical protein
MRATVLLLKPEMNAETNVLLHVCGVAWSGTEPAGM